MEALKVLKSGRDLIWFTFLENSSGCFVEKRSWEGKNRSQGLLRGYFCCDQSLKVTLNIVPLCFAFQALSSLRMESRQRLDKPRCRPMPFLNISYFPKHVLPITPSTLQNISFQIWKCRLIQVYMEEEGTVNCISNYQQQWFIVLSTWPSPTFPPSPVSHTLCYHGFPYIATWQKIPHLTCMTLHGQHGYSFQNPSEYPWKDLHGVTSEKSKLYRIFHRRDGDENSHHTPYVFLFLPRFSPRIRERWKGGEHQAGARSSKAFCVMLKRTHAYLRDCAKNKTQTTHSKGQGWDGQGQIKAESGQTLTKRMSFLRLL